MPEEGKEVTEMGYFERLPLIGPGTLVATSQGVAVYMASGRVADGATISRPMMQLMRRGSTFLEPSDEWTVGAEEPGAGSIRSGRESEIQLKT